MNQIIEFIFIYFLIKSEKLSGSNKVSRVWDQRTGAHHDDWVWDQRTGDHRDDWLNSSKYV